MNSEPFAIVGMECRFPEAASIEDFETLLFEGRSGVREMPPHLLDRELYYVPEKGQPGKTYTTLGGYLDAAPIDLSLLNLDRQRAAEIDPVHLRFAEVAVKAWKRAGLTRGNNSDVSGIRTGVFVGHSGATQFGGPLSFATQIAPAVDFLHDVPEFSQLSEAAQQQVTNAVIEQVRATRPARTRTYQPQYQGYTAAALPAEILGLNGPRSIVDAACASSLFALQHALQALDAGRIEAAIVGGATTNGVDNLILFSQSQACSDQGSRPFDDDASGLISSEGYAAIVVTTLSAAQRWGCDVLGVITGLGIASDGKGKSLWAPRAEGQQLAVSRAYPTGSALDIDYLEAHATSTQLGDATELHSLNGLLSQTVARRPQGLLLGSVKSNLGHTLETAGMAGLLKVLLSMQRGKIPASLNFETPNRNFDWEHGKLTVVSQTRPWPSSERGPRAAVSAFGIGGLNAHLTVTTPARIRSSEREHHVRTSNTQEPIAIVGRGVVLPSAHNLAAFRKLLMSGESVIGPPPADRWHDAKAIRPDSAAAAHTTPTAMGGYIDGYQFDSQSYRIPPKQVKQSNPIQMMLLDAVTQAGQEMDGGKWDIDRTRAGVVIGTIFGGDFGNQLQVGLRLPEVERILRRELSRLGLGESESQSIFEAFRKRVLAAWPALLDETGSFTASTLASRVAKTFDLMGGACALDADNASGVCGLQVALDQLRSGEWDLALCGSAQRSMDLAAFEQLNLAGQLVVSGRPQDIPDSCERILPGEGVVMLFLRRLSDAVEAGCPIFGIIDGIDSTPDTGALSAPGKWAGAAELARQIGYLCGAQELVQMVASSLRWESPEMFQPARPQARIEIPTCAADGQAYVVKCRSPHLKPESGQVVTRRQPAARQQQDATAKKPIPGVPAKSDLSNRLSSDAVLQTHSNGQTVISRADEEWKSRRIAGRQGDQFSEAFQIMDRSTPANRTQRSPRILRVSAATAADLQQKLQALVASSQGVVDLEQSVFTTWEPVRLAILEEAEQPLATRLSAVVKQLKKGRTAGVLETERAVLWTVQPTTARMAWLFPGQGSHYRELPAILDEGITAPARLSELDEIFARLGLDPVSAVLGTEREAAANDIWWNQISVYILGLALTAEARGWGLRPDAVLGHSFGEYAAMTAADVISPEQAVRMVKARCDAVTMTVHASSQLVSVRGNPAEVSAVISQSELPAVITHYNAPRQTVIAVDREHAESVRQALMASNLASVPIPVPVAYHTDRLAGAENLLRPQFAAESLRPPSCSFLSTTTARFIGEPDDLRDSLVHQLTRPVMYVPCIERLLTGGFQLLLEVGPNNILSRLNQEIVGERALCLSLDLPGRSLSERRLMLQAACEVLDLMPPVVEAVPAVRSARSSGGRDTSSRSGNSTADVASSAVSEIEVIDLRKTRRGEENGNGQKIDPVPASPVERPRTTQRVVSATPSKPPVLAESSGSPAESQIVAVPDRQEMREFLKTVIVDLTGYDPSVVDAEADLEADLGVDSIKKAQVIGELAEHYGLGIAPSGVKLSDFKTIDDIVEMAARDRGSVAATGGPSEGASNSVSGLNGRVVRSIPVSPATNQAEVRPVDSPKFDFDLAAVEKFLVDLVVDQTGYSPDVVDLDAELEADLGIDSIKQAQLLGEVQQHFDLRVVSTERNALSQFSTLRSILNFLSDQLGGDHSQTSSPPSVAADTGSDSSTSDRRNGGDPGHSRVASSTVGEPERVPPSNLNGNGRVFGSDPHNQVPEQWKALFAAENPTAFDDEAWASGHRRGARHQQEIRSALRLLVDLAPAKIGEPVSECPLPERSSHFDEESSDGDGSAMSVELEGLAEGAGVSVESVARAHHLFAKSRTVVIPDSQPEQNDARVKGDRQPLKDTKLAKSFELPPSESLRDRGTMRFALRMVSAPQREGMPEQPLLNGACLVVGKNPIAQEIRRRVEAAGQVCHMLPTVASLPQLDDVLDGLWQQAAPLHLFLTSSHDADALQELDPGHWEQRRFAALEVPYRVCQIWMQRFIDEGRLPEASVVAVVNLGGDFGFSGKSATSPEGGLGALVKAMTIECWMRGFRATPMKVIDVGPGTTATQVIDGVWKELAVPSYDAEIAIHGSERWMVQPIPATLEVPEDYEKVVDPRLRSGNPVPREASRNGHIQHGGTWIITGGGRGITAVVARELARRHDLKLHLIGTVERPDLTERMRKLAATDRSVLRREIVAEASARNENGMSVWRNLEKGIEVDATLEVCRAEGIDAEYHACNLADLPKLERLVQKIRAEDGPIRGVIHGAGVGQDARFDRKRPDKVDQCFRAKIDGCLNMVHVTRRDPLDWFVAFGSISGRFGANGHTDYSTANDFMAKIIDRYRGERPDVRSATFHWHAWGDIGMATKPETQLALKMINMEFMPAAEGIAHFLNELEYGGDEPEVLITDRNYYRKFYPADRAGVAQRNGGKPNAVLPMLDAESTGDPGVDAGYEVSLDPQAEPFLRQHLVQGRPTLPFVVALELMAEAARSASGNDWLIEARNVSAMQALKWNSDEPQCVRLKTQSSSEGWTPVELRSDIRRRDGRLVAEDRVFFEGEFRTSATEPRLQQQSLERSAFRGDPIEYLSPEAPIYHGPDLQCLRSIHVQEGRATGIISASANVQLMGERRPTAGWSIHCAAMDACLYAAAVFVGRISQRASLPVRFERILFGRLPDPGEPCRVELRLHDKDAEGATLKFSLVGHNQEVLLDVQGYRVGWLS